MKLAGFLLLFSGWWLTAAAVVLLAAAVPRNAFVFAGIAVQVLGLVLAFRAHAVRAAKGERQ
jgi:hypothetical protein